MSRFSERSPRTSKFKNGVTDLWRSYIANAAWPIAGKGEKDDAARGNPFFRSYGTRVSDVSAPKDRTMFRGFDEAGRPVRELGVPVSRLWSFVIEAGVSLRTTVASPQFLGPALVTDLQYRYVGAANNIGGLTLMWATDRLGVQLNGALTPLPPGEKIFHPASVSLIAGTNDVDEIPEHLIEVAPGTDPNAPVVEPLNYWVNTINPFFLKATTRGPTAAGTLHIRGTVTIQEYRDIELPGSDIDLRQYPNR